MTQVTEREEGLCIEGELILPEQFTAELMDAMTANPFRVFTRPAERKPFTLRERFRIWRHDLRWSIHDRLFPDCSDER